MKVPISTLICKAAGIGDLTETVGSGNNMITRSERIRWRGPATMRRVVMHQGETGTSVAMSLDGNGGIARLIRQDWARNSSLRNVAVTYRRSASPSGCDHEQPELQNPERSLRSWRRSSNRSKGLAEVVACLEVPVTGWNVFPMRLGTPICRPQLWGIVCVLPTALPVSSTFTEEGLLDCLVGGFGTQIGRQFGGTQYAKMIEKARCGEFRRRSTWITKK